MILLFVHKNGILVIIENDMEGKYKMKQLTIF